MNEITLEGIELDRYGVRVRRCPYCDRIRYQGWNDICKKCEKDYEKQQKWIHSTEYLKLVNESLKKKGLLYDTRYA